MEFREFPKIPRLNRDIVITEKIDGTNACIVVVENELLGLQVFAQSRKRVLRPGETDNFGFRAWVEKNAEALKLLGPGHHYGEWYGQGIQRGYGLQEKRFALFDAHRWGATLEQATVFESVRSAVPTIGVVPVMYSGPRRGDAFMEPTVWCIEELQRTGSRIVPGYTNPEGIVVFHTASRQLYKVTCEKDEAAKGTFAGMHSGGDAS